MNRAITGIISPFLAIVSHTKDFANTFLNEL